MCLVNFYQNNELITRFFNIKNNKLAVNTCTTLNQVSDNNHDNFTSLVEISMKAERAFSQLDLFFDETRIMFSNTLYLRSPGLGFTS